MNKILSTKNAPAAIGPYSQGVQAGNTVYVSGQLYFVPETGELLEGTIGEMTEQCMKNIADSGGSGLHVGGHRENDDFPEGFERLCRGE